MRQLLVLLTLFLSAVSHATADAPVCDTRDSTPIEFVALGKTALLTSHLHPSSYPGEPPVVDRQLSIPGHGLIALPVGSKLIDEPDIGCTELIADFQVAIADSLRSGVTLDTVPENNLAALLNPALCGEDGDGRCSYASIWIFLEGTDPARIADLMASRAPIIRIKESAYVESVWALDIQTNELVPLWAEGC